jgi:cytochrome P450
MRNPMSIQAQAVRRDRKVYLSHPVAFSLLRALSGLHHLRIGRIVIVNDLDLIRGVLTEVELDRTAVATTGSDLLGSIGIESGIPFASDERDLPSVAAKRLGHSGIAELQPLWRAQLDTAQQTLLAGGRVDVVQVARTMSAASACHLLGIDPDRDALIDAVLSAARESVDRQLVASRPRAKVTVAQVHPTVALIAGMMQPVGPGLLNDLLDSGRDPDLVRGAGVAFALAAVATTVASVPRATALASDLGLWNEILESHSNGRELATLSEQMLRYTAPTGMIPRVAAQNATVETPAGVVLKVRAGDRLLLVATNAARHGAGLPGESFASAAQTRIVFGAGPRVCPGASIARAQVALALEVLAPTRPQIVQAVPDRRAALPSWKHLIVEARL